MKTIGIMFRKINRKGKKTITNPNMDILEHADPSKA